MKKKFKGYALGTGKKGTIDYIPSPSEVFAEQNINVAKAKLAGQTDPLANAFGSLSQLVTMAAPMLSGIGEGGEEEGGFNPENLTGLDPKALKNLIAGTGSPQGEIAAHGGMKSGKVEVEGKEVIETPDGEVTELKGPSHEEGGIKMNLPDGTRVFSDRLMVKGKTMADRKKARESRAVSLEKKYSGKDPITKGTLQRELLKLKSEEDQDMQIQELANSVDTTFSEVQKGLGGEIWNALKSGVKDAHVGNLLSMYGTYKQGKDALETVEQSRATDTVNKNMYEGFGQDALDANAQAQEMVKGQMDNANKDVERNMATSRAQNRSSARGVAQKRAMDLASTAQANKAKEGVYDKFSKQTMSLLGQQAQLENAQDSAVMQGAAQADAANRADKDAYYSSLGVARNTKNTATQQLGKNLNSAELERMMANIMDNFSKYGVTFDRKGNTQNSQ
tara:strand:+ start:1121 stop:2467 length:1347 start_codon:yes stop_codon:yes gene_type:complete